MQSATIFKTRNKILCFVAVSILENCASSKPKKTFLIVLQKIEDKYYSTKQWLSYFQYHASFFANSHAIHLLYLLHIFYQLAFLFLFPVFYFIFICDMITSP